MDTQELGYVLSRMRLPAGQEKVIFYIWIEMNTE